MENIKDLIERLNATDECSTIEAKKGRAIDKSILETVCAFANEPGLEGGYILLGVEKDETMLFPYYTVTGIIDSDKLQRDFATQCASVFNTPIRPEIEIEKVNGDLIVIKIFVYELPAAQKPLYFKNELLPRGAYRRIGSTDQRCTEDDLYIFYNKEDSLDSSVVKDSSYEDISEEAIELYKKFRGNVNPYAEELTYTNLDLLKALGCRNGSTLTYTGLLVFGKRMSLRRLLPMVRVDYIRVPGNEWVSNPENRFTTIDMRGPLIELVQRTFSAIADDLPKGFLLPDGQLQAESIGLPSKVLREAIVNAFIHRTYRENQPIQVIRYGNRIEIKNPGFSLKPEEQLGEPGSKNRNPFIASIFHETNLAETKGSGIRTMRALMETAGMAPPTFESDHSANLFTIRLLLHHFLSEDDLLWLNQFTEFHINDSQKRALIFLRETGAIDNSVYRQLNGIDVLKASSELRAMRDSNIIEQKGKGRATYYVQGPIMRGELIAHSSLSKMEDDPTYFPEESLIEPVDSLSNQSNTLIEPVNDLPDTLKTLLSQLEIGKRSNDKSSMNEAIVALCKWRPLKLSELASILKRRDKHLLYTYVTPLREEGKIQYTIPDMPNHPDQAYTVSNE